ncbi:unnamed protein product [Didymodactylos carnosus]|uniref:Uncharacterized protein n=1 Tax=Didymodactylos carnosus TaxID=1234261 RepID=A0A815BWU2_9BILA|nr:unnamed protein product [Didymodactylos carnosus]CAF1277459.1 unnamed protein product [Didymodactylos carnosus]CAF3623056.1 unnamed protein product [Didymodactylos carnosus]CAF4070183.1 unnamed protein product [Didymodactylos carnosus]
MKGIKLQSLPFFYRKHRRHRNQLEASDEIVAQGDQNIAHRQSEVRSEIDMESAVATRCTLQLNPSDSRSSNCISEELQDEEQQYQVLSNSELPDQWSNGSNQSMNTTRNRTLTKPVSATLINTGKGSQASSEDTANGASDSAFVDDNSNLPTLDGSMAISGKQNVVQSSMSRIPIAADTPIANSMKSLKIIFPSTSQAKYEPMFLLEKIAFIYIELVVKRGYKAMTNWPFRNLAR